LSICGHWPESRRNPVRRTLERWKDRLWGWKRIPSTSAPEQEIRASLVIGHGLLLLNILIYSSMIIYKNSFKCPRNAEEKQK
jgi:hypothetical protein